MKGMTNPEHYQGCEESFDDFEFTAIPRTVLVDKKGTIVWTGNPASVNLESKIAELVSEGNEE